MERRWTVEDRHGNSIYLTQERWEHIIDPLNHPEMSDYESHLQQTIRESRRKQDLLNPMKYRYTHEFDDLAAENTHIVAIVLFRFTENEEGHALPNNYIVTAYQKVLR